MAEQPPRFSVAGAVPPSIILFAVAVYGYVRARTAAGAKVGERLLQFLDLRGDGAEATPEFGGGGAFRIYALRGNGLRIPTVGSVVSRRARGPRTSTLKWINHPAIFIGRRRLRRSDQDIDILPQVLILAACGSRTGRRWFFPGAGSVRPGRARTIHLGRLLRVPIAGRWGRIGDEGPRGVKSTRSWLNHDLIIPE